MENIKQSGSFQRTGAHYFVFSVWRLSRQAGGGMLNFAWQISFFCTIVWVVVPAYYFTKGHWSRYLRLIGVLAQAIMITAVVRANLELVAHNISDLCHSGFFWLKSSKWECGKKSDKSAHLKKNFCCNFWRMFFFLKSLAPFYASARFEPKKFYPAAAI